MSKIDVINFVNLQLEVYKWSLANFGEQVSKATGATLGSLSPLLGIGEELGELIDAETDEQREDALADTIIYFLDYTTRERVDLGKLFAREQRYDFFETISVHKAYFQLLHVVLKRHQGIRGYEVTEKYVEERDQHLTDLICMLLHYDEFENQDFNTVGKGLELAIKTFENIVGHRVWDGKEPV